MPFGPLPGRGFNIVPTVRARFRLQGSGIASPAPAARSREVEHLHAGRLADGHGDVPDGPDLLHRGAAVERALEVALELWIDLWVCVICR